MYNNTKHIYVKSGLVLRVLRFSIDTFPVAGAAVLASRVRPPLDESVFERLLPESGNGRRLGPAGERRRDEEEPGSDRRQGLLPNAVRRNADENRVKVEGKEEEGEPMGKQEIQDGAGTRRGGGGGGARLADEA